MRKIFVLIRLIISLRIIKLIFLNFENLRINKLRSKNFLIIKKLIESCRNNINIKKKTKKKKGYILIEGMWDNPMHWIRMALLKPSIEKKYGSDTILLNLKSTNREAKKDLKELKYRDEIIIPEKYPESYINKAKSLLKKHRNISDETLYNLKFPNSYPAFYFYDEVLKKNAIGNIIGTEVNYISYIAKTFFYLKFYQNLLKKNKIKVAILSHQVSIRYSTLIWLLIGKKIPVYLTSYYNGHIIIKKIVNKSQLLKPFDDVFNLQDLKKLGKKKKLEITGESKKYMKKLKSGKDGELTVFGIHNNFLLKCKSKKTFCEELNIKNNNPIAVIFANCWTDYPSGYGKNPFSNYVAWFQFILNNVSKIKKINWIVKPHPGEKFYGEKITCQQLIKKSDFKNITIWPKKFTNAEVEKYVDYVISARSSSTLEYGINGKKVICSFPSPFSPFKFVNFASGKKN